MSLTLIVPLLFVNVVPSVKSPFNTTPYATFPEASITELFSNFPFSPKNPTLPPNLFDPAGAPGEVSGTDTAFVTFPTTLIFPLLYPFPDKSTYPIDCFPVTSIKASSSILILEIPPATAP